MNKRLIIYISTFLLIILLSIVVFYLFLYKSPPSIIGNDYLIDTKEIIVSSYENGLMNHIQDEVRIHYIIEDLEFKKIKAGNGMDSPTTYQADFIGSNYIFTLYFNDRNAEMSFYPETQFSNWDKLNITAGTIVPVYRTVLDEEKLSLLVTCE